MLSVLKLIAAVAIAAMLTPTVFAQQRQTGGPARLESKASEQAKAAFRDARLSVFGKHDIALRSLQPSI